MPKNMSKFRTYFSSLIVKVFLGFWIIAIIATGVTRWVSFQFIQSERIEAIKVDQKEFINKVLLKIDKVSTRHTDRAIQDIIKKSRGLPPGIWVKDPVSGEIFHNERRIHPQQLKTIKQLSFEQPVSIFIPGYHLFGPFEQTIHNKKYHIFLGNRMDRQDIAGILVLMPIWLRILVAFTVTGALSLILSWYLISPIKKITRASEQFGAGNLATRIPEFDNRFDEVGQLGQAFNHMADHIQSSISSQQRLLGDVSHELRSPLTRLQIALTLAQKIEHNSPDLDKYLSRFELEIGRLDLMIGQALQLSRLENQLSNMQLSDFDFSTMVNTIINDAKFSAQEKQLTINYHGTNTITFTGDQQLLSSAIENIMNNAIRYSPEKADISVNLTTTNEHIILTVSDQGIGVANEHIKEIFKPFYRTTQARDRISGGTGLGLAIAAGAIECHDGKIFAMRAREDAEYPGLKVIIELPIQ